VARDALRFIDRLAKFVDYETVEFSTSQETGASVIDYPSGNVIKASRMDDIADEDTGMPF